MEEDYPILKPKNKRRRPVLDSSGKTWIPLPSAWEEPVNLPWKIEDWEKETLPPKKNPYRKDTICCTNCGWDSGIGVISHIYLRSSVICPSCGTTVIHVNNPTL